MITWSIFQMLHKSIYSVTSIFEEQKIERRKHTHKQGGINISDLSIYSWYEKNYINT